MVMAMAMVMMMYSIAERNCDKDLSKVAEKAIFKSLSRSR